MKIKYLAWKKVICSDVKRLVYGINGPGVSNKKDHAIQNFNTLNENPGLWQGFTNGDRIPRKKEVERNNRSNGTDFPTTYDILLQNSVNPLRLWEDKNDSRKNPIKINHEIWDRSGDHAHNIIETWYLGYMRVLRDLLLKLIERDGEEENLVSLKNFVVERLNSPDLNRENLLSWIHETQDAFNNLTLDTRFLADANLHDVKSFVENSFYIVAKCEEEDGSSFNVAVMGNVNSADLHPIIRNLLTSSEKKGGGVVNIDMSRTTYDVDVSRLQEILNEKKNVILYGPPGTGKTHLLGELAQSFSNSSIFDDFNTEAPFSSSSSEDQNIIEWCTFHPNYSYENFVIGLEPVVVDGNLGFKPHIGPFLRTAEVASKGNKALLIVDEINRAKTEDVFGNVLAILENSNISNERVKLNQSVELNGEIVDYISASNQLFIVGTMNSLDRSVSPLSYELKRRFTIFELSPKVDVLREHLNMNINIPEEVTNFTCKLMEYLNLKIREYCGKEYEYGQGYFWDLTRATTDFLDVLSDIISNKLLPHIKDVFPQEYFVELLGVDNINVLFESTDYGFELKDIDSMTRSQVINSMAIACGSVYRCLSNGEEVIFTNFEDYENNKIKSIYEKLKKYTNVILAGCSGVGKSSILNKISRDYDFSAVEKMHWHSSTSYDEVIEGITAIATDDEIEYKLRDGAVKALAELNIEGSKLMIIENIDRSNAAENFGELITLLEPDKREGAYVRGYNGFITLPSNMYFLCSMNPVSFSINHLDSALKRRFVIINIQPDYLLLQLWLDADNYEEDELDIDEIMSFSEKQLKTLAIQILKHVNESIKITLGTDAQIGHAVFWDLKHNCSIKELISCIDENFIPILEGICDDEEVSRRILGKNSPLIKMYNHGVEILHLSSLSIENLVVAIKEIIGNE